MRAYLYNASDWEEDHQTKDDPIRLPVEEEKAEKCNKHGIHEGACIDDKPLLDVSVVPQKVVHVLSPVESQVIHALLVGDWMKLFGKQHGVAQEC